MQFGELHALALHDMNGDGLPDIVTGKRWWSHGAQGDPEPGRPAVLYWLELVRENESVRFLPHLVDDNSGVGITIASVQAAAPGGGGDGGDGGDGVAANTGEVFIDADGKVGLGVA